MVFVLSRDPKDLFGIFNKRPDVLFSLWQYAQDSNFQRYQKLEEEKEKLRQILLKQEEERELREGRQSIVFGRDNDEEHNRAMAISMRRRKVDDIINSMEEEDILKWEDELRGRQAGIDDDYIVKLVGEGEDHSDQSSDDEQITEEVDPDEIISSITPTFIPKAPKPQQPTKFSINDF